MTKKKAALWLLSFYLKNKFIKSIYNFSAKLFELRASLKTQRLERITQMGRKKVDRSDKVMQTFETTRPLKVRLEELAAKRGITVSALIREILERHFEERIEF